MTLFPLVLGSQNWGTEGSRLAQISQGKDTGTGQSTTQPEAFPQRWFWQRRTSVRENYCNRSPETNPSHRAAANPTGDQHPAFSLPSQDLLLSFSPLFGTLCLLCSKSPVQETRRSRSRQKWQKKRRKGSSHIQFPEHSLQYLKFSIFLIHLLNPHWMTIGGRLLARVRHF